MAARRINENLWEAHKRQSIQDAVVRVMCREGVSAVTMERVAQEVGIAKGTVYLYYRSKDEILRQLLDLDLAELRDETVPAIAAPGELDARLRRYVSAMLAFFDRKREFIDHCQLELSPDARKQIRVTLSQLYREQMDAWDAALREAVADGSAAPGASGAAAGIVSLARGLALQRLAGPVNEPVDVAAASASELIWKGLAAR